MKRFWGFRTQWVKSLFRDEKAAETNCLLCADNNIIAVRFEFGVSYRSNSRGEGHANLVIIPYHPNRSPATIPVT